MNREDEDTLNFRYSRLTWKHWVGVIAANLILYWVITAIRG